MAEDALATALAGYVHEKWDIPAPNKAGDGQVSVPVPTVVAAKALYSAMKAQRITKVELADRLGVSESAVRKLGLPLGAFESLKQDNLSASIRLTARAVTAVEFYISCGHIRFTTVQRVGS